MRTRLSLIGLLCLLAINANAQEPKPASQPAARTVVFDIDVLDISNDQHGDLEKTIRDKRTFDRMIADGKIRPLANVQIRTRTGEQASSRTSQRVPVQVSNSPQANAQVQYENTGLNVEVEPRMLDADRISVRLKIEMSAVVNVATAPTFLQRTINDVVNVRNAETVVIVSVNQIEGLLPPSNVTRPKDQTVGNFVVLLTARLMD